MASSDAIVNPSVDKARLKSKCFFQLFLRNNRRLLILCPQYLAVLLHRMICFDVKSEFSDDCQIDFDVKSEFSDDCQIDFDVKSEFSDDCQIDFDVKSEFSDDCQIDFDVKSEFSDDCQMDFDGIKDLWVKKKSKPSWEKVTLIRAHQ